MKKNVGTTDRIIRFVFFDFTIAFPLTGGEFPEWLGITLSAVGIFLLITVIIARCPIYKLLQVDTRERQTKE